MFILQEYFKPYEYALLLYLKYLIFFPVTKMYLSPDG